MTVPPLFPASRLLISATDPVKVTELVPEVLTVTTLVPAVTVKIPLVTGPLKDNVAVMVVASTSPIDKPLLCKFKSVCSVAA